MNVDIFIGLIFAFLLMSLLSSTVLEMLSGWLSFRGNHLDSALESMLSPYFKLRRKNVLQLAWLKIKSMFVPVAPDVVPKDEELLPELSHLSDGNARSATASFTPEVLQKTLRAKGFEVRPGASLDLGWLQDASRSRSADGTAPPPPKLSLFADFVEHPVFRLMGKAEARRKPSYLSKEHFSEILFDSLAQMSGGKDLATIQKGVSERLLASDLRETLLFHLNASPDEETFRLRLQDWFATVMERVSGWYKRYTSFWLFLIGFVLAVFFNANVFQLYNALSENPQRAKEAADLAERFVKNNSDLAKPVTPSAPAYIPPAPVPQPTPTDTSKKTPSKQPPAPPTKVPVGPTVSADSLQLINQKRFDLVRNELDEASDPLGMGWSSGIVLAEAWHTDTLTQLWAEKKYGPFAKERFICALKAFRNGLFGWLLMGLAVCLGAPFWFDLLKKFIQIRNVGGKPDETPKPQSPAAPNQAQSRSASLPSNKILVDKPKG